MEETVAKQGYLFKQGEWVQNWKRRWFVLKGRTLSYYDSELKANGGSKAKGTIALQTYRAKMITNRSFCDKPNSFVLLPEDKLQRPYLLYADTENEMDGWIRTLNKYGIDMDSKLLPDKALSRRAPTTSTVTANVDIQSGTSVKALRSNSLAAKMDSMEIPDLFGSTPPLQLQRPRSSKMRSLAPSGSSGEDAYLQMSASAGSTESSAASTPVSASPAPGAVFPGLPTPASAASVTPSSVGSQTPASASGTTTPTAAASDSLASSSELATPRFDMRASLDVVYPGDGAGPPPPTLGGSSAPAAAPGPRRPLSGGFPRRPSASATPDWVGTAAASVFTELQSRQSLSSLGPLIEELNKLVLEEAERTGSPVPTHAFPLELLPADPAFLSEEEQQQYRRGQNALSMALRSGGSTPPSATAAAAAAAVGPPAPMLRMNSSPAMHTIVHRRSPSVGAGGGGGGLGQASPPSSPRTASFGSFMSASTPTSPVHPASVYGHRRQASLGYSCSPPAGLPPHHRRHASSGVVPSAIVFGPARPSAEEEIDSLLETDESWRLEQEELKLQREERRTQELEHRRQREARRRQDEEAAHEQLRRLAEQRRLVDEHILIEAQEQQQLVNQRRQEQQQRQLDEQTGAKAEAKLATTPRSETPLATTPRSTTPVTTPRPAGVPISEKDPLAKLQDEQQRLSDLRKRDQQSWDEEHDRELLQREAARQRQEQLETLKQEQIRRLEDETQALEQRLEREYVENFRRSRVDDSSDSSDSSTDAEVGGGNTERRDGDNAAAPSTSVSRESTECEPSRPALIAAPVGVPGVSAAGDTEFWLRFFSLQFPADSARFYATLFVDNGLQEGDLRELTHDLLKSMDVSAAKTRMEILRLKDKWLEQPPATNGTQVN